MISFGKIFFGVASVKIFVSGLRNSFCRAGSRAYAVCDVIIVDTSSPPPRDLRIDPSYMASKVHLKVNTPEVAVVY